MFSKNIIDSDAFLEMPVSSQCLYFHLGMRADDDGFVNSPKKIQRIINASDDDMRILLSKRFILVFESGVIVIKHWRMNNYLRTDRYKPTVYQTEIEQLQIKENGSYTERLPSGIPMVYQRLTQVRIGKDRIGEEREDTCTSFSPDMPAPEEAHASQEKESIQSLSTTLGGYPGVVLAAWGEIGEKVYQPLNLLQFLQTWGRDIAPYVKGVHSDDVLGAIKNFKSVACAPEGTYYWSQKIGISAFMQKHLEKFIPQNFSPDDFKPHLSFKDKEAAETAAAMEKVFGRGEG